MATQLQRACCGLGKIVGARSIGASGCKGVASRYAAASNVLPVNLPSVQSYTNSSHTDSENNKMFVSQMKTPIVHQLWMAREKAKQIQAQKSGENDSDSLSLSESRRPSLSQTDICYEFSEDEYLKEQYRNPFGQIRMGRIVEDLDALAGNIAFAHVLDPGILMVTASVDRIQVKSPPSLEVDHHLQGKVTYVGKSSMEIRMSCRTDPDGQEWLEAFFTFVATDPTTHRPVRIPPLDPETELEKQQFEAGERRAQLKKDARKRKDGPSSIVDAEHEQRAQGLLQQAGALLNMPGLADPNSILMASTKMQNAEVAQPQVRNLANAIFGGFLMRRAFELAFATCYVFGGGRPRFLELEEVSFQVPVNVGDLTVFNSRILYTSKQDSKDIQYDVISSGTHEIPVVTVHVEAWIAEPETATAKISNSFYFTFAIPEKAHVRQVLPSNIDEARSMVRRMVADEAQNAE